MAYIEKEVAAKKRKAIRAMYPAKDGWKWSVVVEHYSSLNVRLMKYPKGYDFPEHASVNHYTVADPYSDAGYGEKENKVLEDVVKIMMEGHWDKSEIMTDYHHCAWYNTIAIGKWDVPAVSS